MTSTVPYSVRIPKDLLEEMKRLYDRMEPPKPSFSAILSHVLKMGWEAYASRAGSGLHQAIFHPVLRTASVVGSQRGQRTPQTVS